MKILHINAHLEWTGGIEVYLLSLLPELKARGHDPQAIVAAGKSALWPQAHFLPMIDQVGWKVFRRGYREANRVIAEIAPDVIHLHNIHNVGVVRACFDTAPTVVTSHDYRYLCPASNFFYRRSEAICQQTSGPTCFLTTISNHCMSLRPRYAWHYYRRVQWFIRNFGRLAHLIAPSESVRLRFLQAGMPEDRTSTLPYFCPMEPMDEPRPEPTTPVILFVGRIRPNKGYQYFVEALGQLDASVQGIIVGDVTPERERELRRVARRAGCLERLELRVWASRDRIPDVYREATIFVLPSVWAETLGIVGLEALACGVPVVASNVGGVTEWLHDGTTGLLVPPKDASALADAIRGLLASHGQRAAIGRHGLSLIRSRFTRHAHVAALERVYRGDRGRTAEKA